MDILFEQKNTLDNFDLMINNCDLENVMKRYSFRIIQRYGISGCLLGALVMGLLCKLVNILCNNWYIYLGIRLFQMIKYTKVK